jgi:hypothetical protein
MVVRELIVDVNHEAKRLVWSARSELMTHHNGSAQVIRGEDGQSKVVRIADLLPDEAAGPVGQMMERGMAVMKATLDALSGVHPEARQVGGVAWTSERQTK